MSPKAKLLFPLLAVIGQLGCETPFRPKSQSSTNAKNSFQGESPSPIPTQSPTTYPNVVLPPKIPTPQTAATCRALPLGIAGRSFYVDFSSGDDTKDGLSTQNAWKHAPGDAAATGKAATAKPAPGDAIIFKGGVHYFGTLNITFSGTLEKPIIYEGFSCWGQGRAVIDGSVPLQGWAACTSQNDCAGNPNWRNIFRINIPELPSGIRASTYAPLHLNLIENDVPLLPSQYPKSISPLYKINKNYLRVPATQVTKNSLTDSRLADFGGPSLVGAYIYLWVNPNAITTLRIQSYDSASNKIIFDRETSVYQDRDSLYAIANSPHPGIFNQIGTYYFNPQAESDGSRRLYLWPHDPKNITEAKVDYSVLQMGVKIYGNKYLNFQGFKIQKFSGVIYGSGNALTVTGGASNIKLIDNELTLLHGDGYASLSIGGDGSYQSEVTVEGNWLHDMPGSNRSMQAVNADNIRFLNNVIERAGGTSIFYSTVRDGLIENNIIRDCMGPHANGISVYTKANNVLVKGNYVTRSNIPFTMETSSNINIEGNIFDGSDVSTFVLATWGGMFGSNKIINNIIIGSDKTNSLLLLTDLGASYTVEGNVIDGGGIAHGAGQVSSNNTYVGLSHSQNSANLGPGEKIEIDQSRVFVRSPRLISTPSALEVETPSLLYLPGIYEGVPQIGDQIFGSQSGNLLGTIRSSESIIYKGNYHVKVQLSAPATLALEEVLAIWPAGTTNRSVDLTRK